MTDKEMFDFYTLTTGLVHRVPISVPNICIYNLFLL